MLTESRIDRMPLYYPDNHDRRASSRQETETYGHRDRRRDDYEEDFRVYDSQARPVPLRESRTLLA
jgi:hypothetical protein